VQQQSDYLEFSAKAGNDERTAGAKICTSFTKLQGECMGMAIWARRGSLLSRHKFSRSSIA